jgi:hypothetical protein
MTAPSAVKHFGIVASIAATNERCPIQSLIRDFHPVKAAFGIVGSSHNDISVYRNRSGVLSTVL